MNLGRTQMICKNRLIGRERNGGPLCNLTCSDDFQGFVFLSMKITGWNICGVGIRGNIPFLSMNI
jgi:hypothetical protein